MGLTMSNPGNNLDCWLKTDFIAPDEAQAIFLQLQAEVAWRQDEIKMFGKQVKIPRLQAFMADTGINYKYSGLTLANLAWHPLVADIKAQVEDCTQQHFNAVLLNLYRDGNDGMGWHRDNEPELGPNPKIASVSFGESRRFLLKSKDNQRKEFFLNSGSLLWMGEDVQKNWLHSVPKTKQAKAARINLTFRNIIA